MNFFQPRVVLVTGGAGFIGSNFIRYILAYEPSVVVINLDCLTYAGSLDNLKQLPHSERYHFVHGNINNKELVDKILRQHEIDTIIHFAAESHVDRSISDPLASIETNIIGTYTLLEAARRYWLDEKKWSLHQCRFHQISTDEVFGALEPAAPAFKENNAYLPNSPYSASKASADHGVRAYYRTYGLPITISHCSNNYGPYQHREKLIPTIIRCCMEWQRIPIYGEGSQIRDWLYVEDHCKGIMAVVKRGRIGEAYNMGGNSEWENIAIAKYICHLMDELRPLQSPYKNLINFVPDRLGHDFRYAVDITKIKEELGWYPEKGFAEGIKETLAFYMGKMVHAVQ